MDEELSGRVLRAYGVEYTSALRMQKGYRNESHPFVTAAGDTINLIIYKREPDILTRIQRTNYIGDALASQGFPARRTYNPRILRLKAGKIAKYASLYAYMPGETIPWEAYTMTHLKLLGKTMSDMHKLLANIEPPDDMPSVVAEYVTINERMRQYFTEPNVRRAMRAKLNYTINPSIFDRFARMLAGCANLPDQQLLHMDFVRGNILFAARADGKPEITGILDFEKTTWGHPLFDIARTLAFLIVDCKYKEEAKVRSYFLTSGYNKRGATSFKITNQSMRLLDALVELFLVYDLYKFLRHNPYEALRENAHYVRTHTLLRASTHLMLV